MRTLIKVLKVRYLAISDYGQWNPKRLKLGDSTTVQASIYTFESTLGQVLLSNQVTCQCGMVACRLED